VAGQVFESVPHLEDEVTLAWQASAAAGGYLRVPSPPQHASFFVPFVVDFNGARFGKYPPGFPALLSLGIRLGARDLVNPLIAAASLWLMYLLGKKILDEKTALLAVALTFISPFFLMISGSLLTHSWSLFLSAAFCLAWVDLTFPRPAPMKPVLRILAILTAGSCLGLLALTRPWTAVGVAIPFVCHGVFLLVKGSWGQRRAVIAIGLLAALLASLYFVWQAALTGDALTNPYTLWWPKDVIGFGANIGYAQGGHTLHNGLLDTGFALYVGSLDLFGWPFLSYLFIPLGVIALWRSGSARLIGSVFLSLVLVYIFYWVNAWVFGPRYYYEALFSLTLTSAAGIRWAFQKIRLPAVARLRHISQSQFTFAALSFVLLLLVGFNLTIYMPMRLSGLRGIYGANRGVVDALVTPTTLAQTPALIIVESKKNWRPYACLLELSDPFLDTPYIFAVSLGESFDTSLAAKFPDRETYYYDPAHPGVLVPLAKINKK
jgi:4-amino-4-deoxy-L-arabinose transferase-like glycosyltransferase